jgi:hypothetical protein
MTRAGEAFDDRRLAHAGVADEDGVVLRPTAEHLDDPTDLVVASDDRVELPRSGVSGEVAPVLRKCVLGRLGVGRRHPPGST